ncbi:MAG: S8 family serine peptidase [Planctomycetes bacterium]|nr:S8 family serine peptidase [Planctomycetota bacterium]
MSLPRLVAAAALLASGAAALAGDGSATLGAGDSAFGELAPGETDRVLLDGVEGMRISLDLRAGFDPVLVLRDPSGMAVDAGSALRARSSRVVLRSFTLPSTGKWTLEISVDPSGGGGGDFKDKGGSDDAAGGFWFLDTSVRAPRRRRSSAAAEPAGETLVPLGVLPGGATATVKVSGGTLTGISGAPGIVAAGAPGRRASLLVPRTGEWSAVVEAKGPRTVKAAVTLSLPVQAPVDREVLDDDGAPEEEDIVGGTVMVRLREGADEDEFEQNHGGETEGELLDLEWFEVTVPEGMEAEEFLESLGLDDDVIEKEPVLLSESPEGEQSNVAFTASDATKTDVNTQDGFALAGVLQAQALASGSGIKVAIVDSGLLPGGHPDLAGKVLAGWDFVDGDADPVDAADGVDNDLDGLTDEGVGHGTFIAGIVAAVAPEARILPVRVLDSDARGSSLRVAKGIVWAVEAGARIINLSIGVRRKSGVIQDALQVARDRGVLVVVSAGNAGMNGTLAFPGGLSDVVTVTAVDGNGVRPSFANVSSKVDLAAPGVDVLAPFGGSGYARWSGTSFAAPFASAGAALVLSRAPAMDATDAGKVLVDTAVPVDAVNPGLGGSLGKGRVNLPGAVGAAKP